MVVMTGPFLVGLHELLVDVIELRCVESVTCKVYKMGVHVARFLHCIHTWSKGTSLLIYCSFSFFYMVWCYIIAILWSTNYLFM